jgi:hypothetical protein
MPLFSKNMHSSQIKRAPTQNNTNRKREINQSHHHKNEGYPEVQGSLRAKSSAKNLRTTQAS